MSQTTRIIALVLISLFTFCSCGNAASDDAQNPENTPANEMDQKESIDWLSYENGLSRMRSESKKVFLNFYADWCHYCKTMDKKTFTDEKVIDYLNRNFVSVRVNSDQNRKLAANFNVQGLPMSFFLTEEGDNIGGQPGYIAPDQLLPLLKYISTDSYKTMNFKEFIAKQM